jgi:hypothetical protein
MGDLAARLSGAASQAKIKRAKSTKLTTIMIAS